MAVGHAFTHKQVVNYSKQCVSPCFPFIIGSTAVKNIVITNKLCEILLRFIQTFNEAHFCFLHFFC